MSRNKSPHATATPATRLLRAQGVVFEEFSYDWQPHGGALQSAQALGLDPFAVVKTLMMQNQDGQPLIVLMHGNCHVSTKSLARQIGVKHIEPCNVETAQRHSGYLVGGMSPFGLRRKMPTFIERSILSLPRIAINGGRRGYLLGMDPHVCLQLLQATPVDCALTP